jgi:hypothetical protein
VQDLIKQKAKPFDTGQIGVFARKVRCAYCGYTLRSAKNRGKHYLQCQSKHISKDACVGTFMPVAELEQMVIAELNNLSAEYLDKAELERQIDFATNVNQRRNDVQTEINVYKKRMDECSKGIRTLYIDKVKGILSDNDFAELTEIFKKDRDHLERIIASAQKDLQELDNRLTTSDNHMDLIEQYTSPIQLTREMVEILIDHIVIYRRNPETKQIPIEIFWNF